MTSKEPESRDVEELFRAARTLLDAGFHADAAYVLHAEIALALGNPKEAEFPASYSSRSEARVCHERLLSQWRGQAVPQGHRRLRDQWRRRPAWTTPAAVIVMLLGLTLRYAWAVSDETNWPSQHPEGNWISRFYANVRFEGFPLVRYDVGVNSDFGKRGPARRMSGDYFSARWDTCLVVTRDVSVTLQMESDDRSTLWLDGVAQLEIAPGPERKSGSVVLRQGLRHLRVEFVEEVGMALIRLDGLELDGNEAYRFKRPVLEGEDVRCK